MKYSLYGVAGLNEGRALGAGTEHFIPLPLDDGAGKFRNSSFCNINVTLGSSMFLNDSQCQHTNLNCQTEYSQFYEVNGDFM